MKTIALALVVVLTLAPVVFAEETFNPYTGEWEEGPGADEGIQNPYSERPLYKDPDIETSYDAYQHRPHERIPQDETWSDVSEDPWDQLQGEDDLSDSDYDPYQYRPDQQEPQDETWLDASEDPWGEPKTEDDLSEPDDDGWNQPLPEEGYSEGYGDQWSGEQPQEEWTYSPETMERSGPPPPLRTP